MIDIKRISGETEEEVIEGIIKFVGDKIRECKEASRMEISISNGLITFEVTTKDFASFKQQKERNGLEKEI